MANYLHGGSHISTKIKLAYGVGHILNDLCASMWFTYLLVYLQYVLRLDRGLSGFLLLVGQLADAVSTPLVGIQSDKGCSFSFWGYGRRKTWHAIGTICVLMSFPFIFIKCRSCNFYWPNAYVVLIGLMIVVFQFGWASTQVSHLALIPDLTPREEERDELNIIRYFFDASSDVLVYVIAWITFETIQTSGGQLIDPSDYIKFQTVTICVLLIGAAFSLLFHIFTPEASQNVTPDDTVTHSTTGENLHDSQPNHPLASGEDLSLRISMTWKDWLTEPQFYQVSLLYTSARLVANLSMIYMPIYLQETIRAREELLTLIPLVMSLSGVASSVLLKFLRKCASKKGSMVIAILIGLLACVIISVRRLPEWSVYLVAILLGVSGALMIILSLAFTADLIGYCTDSSAFVYGCMSFWDKLVNGFCVFLIQELTRISCNGRDCSNYYRHVMSIGIFIPLLLGLCGICIIAYVKLGRTRKIRRALRDPNGSSGGTPISSDSSEFLIATDSKLGYGAITSL